MHAGRSVSLMGLVREIKDSYYILASYSLISLEDRKYLIPWSVFGWGSGDWQTMALLNIIPESPEVTDPIRWFTIQPSRCGA